MVTAIRIKLVDFLKILSATPPGAFCRPKTQNYPLIETDLEAIRQHLQNGLTERKDLENELGLSHNAMLYRLDLLKERGVIVESTAHCFKLNEGAL